MAHGTPLPVRVFFPGRRAGSALGASTRAFQEAKMASPAGGGLAGAGAEQVSGKPLARNLRSLMHRPSLHLPQRSLAPSDHEFCVLAVTQVSLFLPGCGDGLSLCSMPHAAATAWHPTGTLPWLVLLVPLCSHCTCQSGFVPGWTCLSTDMLCVCTGGSPSPVLWCRGYY